MKQYSPFIQTLYDQPEPVGCLGRGTHYSVLRALSWREPDLSVRSSAQFQDFAVLWDEDHDERIIPIIESLNRSGLLAPIYFIGERKGGLFVVLNPIAVEALGTTTEMKKYREQLEQELPQPEPDYWPLTGFGVLGGAPDGIVNDTDDKVRRYLDSIHLLWNLGHKKP